MQKKQKYKMKQTNRRSAFMGVLVIIAILISGTFAFTYARQAALNPGRVHEHDFNVGRIHDDFEDRDGPGPLDKDVFAENFGLTDLAVRVRFREFLEIGGNVFGGAQINNPQTWPIYLADPDDVHTRLTGTYAAQIGNTGIGWTLGNAEEVQKVFMPTFNHVNRIAPFDPAVTIVAPFNNPNIYRFANTTGRAVEAIAEFDVNTVNNIDDFFSNGVQTGPICIDPATGNIVAISDGTHDFWYLGQSCFSTLHHIDYNMSTPSISTSPTTHYAQETMIADEGGVMTIAQWIDADMPSGNFWIMDVDGWFYWNGYLPGLETRNEQATAIREQLGLEPGDDLPEEHAWLDLPTIATSLLLNGIDIPNLTLLDYIIYIDAEFFTSDQLGEDAELQYTTPEVPYIFLPELFFVDYDHMVRHHVMPGWQVTCPTGQAPVQPFVLFNELKRYRGDRFIGHVPGNFTATFQNDAFNAINLVGLDNLEQTWNSLTEEDTPSYFVAETCIPIALLNSQVTVYVTEPRASNFFPINLNVVEINLDEIETYTPAMPEIDGNEEVGNDSEDVVEG